jgi:hypothetical protein
MEVVSKSFIAFFKIWSFRVLELAELQELYSPWTLPEPSLATELPLAYPSHRMKKLSCSLRARTSSFYPLATEEWNDQNPSNFIEQVS